MKDLSLYEIDQKIADLCKRYANKKISRIQFDDNYKQLNKKRDAKDILKVSQQRVYAMIKEKKLSVKVIGGINFLKRSEVEKFHAARK